jgi:hypothetical protein
MKNADIAQALNISVATVRTYEPYNKQQKPLKHPANSFVKNKKAAAPIEKMRPCGFLTSYSIWIASMAEP